MTRLRLLPVIALLALIPLLAACGKDAPAADPSRSTSSSTSSTSSATPSSTPSATATPKQPRPKVGQCYRLDYKTATSPTSSSAAVPCSSPHTSVTMYVGTFDAIDDGHLLTVDSKQVLDQLATTCPTKVGGWVGGDQDEQRLSRFTAVWFSPTLADADAGATWYRCDLVSVRGKNQLAGLPGTAKGALAAADGLDRFGTCGNDAPSAKDFTRVICSEKHSWAAVKVLSIANDAKYLGPNAQGVADAACKSVGQDRATDPLTYTWSFEWPTKEDWDAGQRYGLCWVPSS